MTDRDTAELEALLDEAVPALLERSRSLVSVPHPTAPEPGSGGALVWNHGIRGLQSAVDHLHAWQLLSHQRPRPILAHYTLLRGAVDGAAAARWLFDRTVDARTRAGRGLRAELTDMQELKKVDDLDPELAAEAGRPPAELIARVRASADAADVEIAAWSSYAARAAQYGGYRSLHKGPGAYLYAVLSAAAHGRLWARHLANQRAILRREGFEDQRVTIMDAETATWATRKVLEVVARAMGDAEAYVATSERGDSS